MDKLIEKLNEFVEKLIRLVLCRLLKIKITDKSIQTLMQFVRFGIVGLSNTVISYLIYVISLTILQKGHIFEHTDYFIAQFIAFVLSVLWSFFWNRKYVFSVDEKQVSWLQALIKTYISYAFTGLFLNWILSWIWVEVVGLSKLIAPIINLLVSVPLNFVLNKFWAFSGKEIR